MNLIFKANDRIRVKENGRMGTIVYAGYVDFWQGDAYALIWDNYRSPVPYRAEDAHDLWEKVDEIKNDISAGVGPGESSLPVGAKWIRVKMTGGGGIGSCDHKWVEVGFNHTKIVCYHCDMDKT